MAFFMQNAQNRVADHAIRLRFAPQKTTMEQNFTKQLRHDLKLTFIAGAGIGITVFAWIRTILSILLISIFFMACKLKTTGITKELDTGLVTKYRGLRPERMRIVMNDETLTHNDIPIGESFRIINEGVSGFESKDGKVSVTCSLEIKDMKGNVLLSAPDLFQGKNLLSKDSVSVLSATVNTGKPMEREEKYEVKAVFKDNYGSGMIENKITIRAIDLP